MPPSITCQFSEVSSFQLANLAVLKKSIKISKWGTGQQQDTPDNGSKALAQLSPYHQTIPFLACSALHQTERRLLQRHSAELQAMAPAAHFTCQHDSKGIPVLGHTPSRLTAWAIANSPCPFTRGKIRGFCNLPQVFLWTCKVPSFWDSTNKALVRNQSQVQQYIVEAEAWAHTQPPGAWYSFCNRKNTETCLENRQRGAMAPCSRRAWQHEAALAAWFKRAIPTQHWCTHLFFLCRAAGGWCFVPAHLPGRRRKSTAKNKWTRRRKNNSIISLDSTALTTACRADAAPEKVFHRSTFC